jgi:hypothetical protein
MDPAKTARCARSLVSSPSVAASRRRHESGSSSMEDYAYQLRFCPMCCRLEVPSDSGAAMMVATDGRGGRFGYVQ